MKFYTSNLQILESRYYFFQTYSYLSHVWNEKFSRDSQVPTTSSVEKFSDEKSIYIYTKTSVERDEDLEQDGKKVVTNVTCANKANYLWENVKEIDIWKIKTTWNVRKE